MKRAFQLELLLFIIPLFSIMVYAVFFMATRDMRNRVSDDLTQTFLSLENIYNSRISLLEQEQEQQSKDLLSKAELLSVLVSQNKEQISNQKWVEETTKNLGVDSVCICDGNGIIIASTNIGFLKFDMASTKQSAEFMPACKDKSFKLVQKPEHRGIDNMMVQYAGVARQDEPGILQVCREYSVESVKDKDTIFQEIIQKQFSDELIYVIRKHGHDERGSFIAYSSNSELVDKYLGDIQFDIFEKKQMIKLYGKRYFFIKSSIPDFEGSIFLLHPQKEMFFLRDRIVVLLTIISTVSLIVIFVILSYSLQKHVIEHIYKINSDLEQIKSGTIISIAHGKASPEFVTLVDSINHCLLNNWKQAKYFNENSKQENAITHSIQTVSSQLIPPFYANVPTIDFYACHDMSENLGADYLHLATQADNAPFFFALDTIGNGVVACLYVMNFQNIMRKIANQGKNSTLSELLPQIRTELAQNTKLKTMYLSAFFAHFHPEDSVLDYVNAGYFPPFIRRAGKDEFETLPVISKVLNDSTCQKDVITSLPMHSGDMFFLCSDGVVESVNSSGALFPHESLLDTLNRLPKDISAKDAIFAMKKAFSDFLGEEKILDDVIMVAMKIK